MEELDFLTRFGSPELLPGAGSNRRYYRLTAPDGATKIGVIGTDRNENAAFVALSRHFRRQGLPVPEVTDISPDGMAYIQDDLGSECLLDRLSDDNLLRTTIRLLPDIQFSGIDSLDFSICHPVAELDRRSVMWDLNYFKYCFLKTSGIEFDEAGLEDDFADLATALLAIGPRGFMYRDFQSRNVMVRDNRPVFIDFQGGRRGPCHYDLASFLWQSRAGFSAAQRDRLIDVYLDSLSRYHTVDRPRFISDLKLMVLFRLLQVLGAYGFRGRFERKSMFLQQIPAALTELRTLLPDVPRYPTLTPILERLTSPEPQPGPSLTVTVSSFSYKNGYPADKSGNGGGFVFDCRAINNPGRYERYRQMTGMDTPVKDFLEHDGGIFPFLDHCYALVKPAVECYIKRGFTHLEVAFGCTGGRHRSVYSAQWMAEHLAAAYPEIKVELIHRERGITSTFPPTV